MDQSKLNESISKLTEIVSENRDAANALQLLVADYYLTKTQVIDLNKKINALGRGGSLSNVLNDTASKIQTSLSGLEGISNKEKEILNNLSEAQANFSIAKSKITEAVRIHEDLSDNLHGFKKNVKNVIGGTIKSFLGPAAEFGPVKEIANELFQS
ncbi:hypothetical protein [Rubellicoccus peritrichatus]|uniref:Uncharacterized protein n=1 Tax=Rubellicoccus peritrichatus TaxID=3080537 RepID=A0AAQ3QRU6_9BACT|nr:hypothetical protein [Puniceicoccus sp. CR14]WOO39646.1 hypothetical protein RZN69_13565 [Puniceicoccus sp. CR14]